MCVYIHIYIYIYIFVCIYVERCEATASCRACLGFSSALSDTPWETSGAAESPLTGRTSEALCSVIAFRRSH